MSCPLFNRCLIFSWCHMQLLVNCSSPLPKCRPRSECSRDAQTVLHGHADACHAMLWGGQSVALQLLFEQKNHWNGSTPPPPDVGGHALVHGMFHVLSWQKNCSQDSVCQQHGVVKIHHGSGRKYIFVFFIMFPWRQCNAARLVTAENGLYISLETSLTLDFSQVFLFCFPYPALAFRLALQHRLFAITLATMPQLLPSLLLDDKPWRCRHIVALLGRCWNGVDKPTCATCCWHWKCSGHNKNNSSFFSLLQTAEISSLTPGCFLFIMSSGKWMSIFLGFCVKAISSK